ncbi:glycosyltransferase family 4 protein [Macrococcoides caseolyticum]|uniref:glycosyltransferase family 4 protein n=1 Tax=Macrococcoides caseolyticum TaxID=69966 RepID=UPI0012FEF831|nr:glycosyltransferase family 4 protein [Macrococcus caseolyticus]
MKKVLFCANVYRHLTSFHMPYIYMLRNNGYKIYLLASDDYGNDKKNLVNEGFECIDIPYSRNPLSFSNLKIFLKIRKLLKENEFDIIHVHTPIISFITRIASYRVSVGKMIYTAHGFHFYKGSSILNWLLYFPLEKLASNFTDTLITINQEDYKTALKYFGDKCKVLWIEGVGVNINISRRDDLELDKLRDSLKLRKDDFVISYIAELNDNKNQMFLFKNWKEINKNIPNAKLLIIGEGTNKTKYLEYIKMNKLANIEFLGYRKDVEVILQITNVVTLLSHREGLPKSVMEAMSLGIPCVVTNTRGLRDLIKDGENGFVIDIYDDVRLINSFLKLYYDVGIYNEYKSNTLNKIKNYSYESVKKKYMEVYEIYI